MKIREHPTRSSMQGLYKGSMSLRLTSNIDFLQKENSDRNSVKYSYAVDGSTAILGFEEWFMGSYW